MRKKIIFFTILIISFVTLIPLSAENKGIELWVADINKRLYPNSFGRDLETREINVQALKNEWVSLQIGVRSCDEKISITTMWEDFRGLETWELINKENCKTRFCGLVPVDENGQLTPDPLFEEKCWEVPANQSQGLWLTIKLPKKITTDIYTGALRVYVNEKLAARFKINIDVIDIIMPDPVDYKFYLNIWQDPEPISRFYNTEPFSEKYWKITEKYVESLVSHGQKSILCTIMYAPWGGVRGFPLPSMVEWKFPGIWKSGEGDKFTFDYSAFDRYVEICMSKGIKESIHCYSVVQGPGNNKKCPIVYRNTVTGEVKTQNTIIGDDRYKEAWKFMLRDLVSHLRKKGWLEKTYIGMDEKPHEDMEKIWPLLKTCAPELKIALAGQGGGFTDNADELAIFIEKLYDLDDPEYHYPDIEARKASGKITLNYTCCAPWWPNTFLFSPPSESREIAWISESKGLDGYLRWAYNSWPDDVWNQPRYVWPSGDMFFVWPGKDGPIESIRWEMLREGIEDYEAIQTLKEKIKKLKQSGENPELAERAEKEIKRAVYLATINVEELFIPWRMAAKIGENIDKARKTINDLLINIEL